MHGAFELALRKKLFSVLFDPILTFIFKVGVSGYSFQGI